jgi:hypothetical protein
MYRHAAIVGLSLLGTMITPAANAIGITTYGAGLKSCKSYLAARQEEDNGASVAFVDWLSGYFSGVNKTSTHRNNFVGLSDLKGAMAWLDDYCNVRPQVHFAEAVGTMLLSGKPGPAAHSIEVTSYASAAKPCDVYLDARQQRDATYLDASAEFTNWLGGYLSGVNAMSLRTDNVLGTAELGDAVSWLEGYCRDHPLSSFGAAVDALVAAQQLRYASQPAPAPGR